MDATLTVAPATGRPLARESLDAGIDWATCPVRPAGGPAAVAAVDQSPPIDVSADAAVAEFNTEQLTFSGNVELTQGEMRMQADQMVLNRATDEVHAKGNFLLIRPDVRLAGDAADYQLKTRQGRVEQASYRVPAMRARGDAERGELLGDGRSSYSNITFTTCAPGDVSWLLSANALELDQQEGMGIARHATLRFMNVPILYAPIFSFPIDDRRRSGLLLPSIGQSSNTGFDLSVPYYLNLAENYDLTLTPRLMSKRGLMLGGEFRFLTESTRGTLKADFLPDDREYGQDRGSASLYSVTQFNPQATANLRLNYVSDNDFFSDLGGDLAATSTTHLERAGELRFRSDNWDLLGRLQEYQTIDDAIPVRNRPYSRLPQLLLNLDDRDGIAGTAYQLDAEYVNFYRENSVRGHRVNLFPRLSLPMRDSWWFVEPKVGAHYTAYQLTDQRSGLDDAPSSLAGMFSMDSGLYFDRSTSYFGSDTIQTLEPRVYYLLASYTDQDDQPVFDTGIFDFNFDNLFRSNRFNGPDRFGDANQVTLALTSRMIGDESGVELLRGSIGQILYFEDREVTLPGETSRDDSTSAFVGEVAAELGGGWGTRAGLQWDPTDGNNGTIDQALAQITYRDRDRHTFNAAYRLRDGVTEQTDLAFFWPVDENFTLIGRHNYSLQESRLLEALAGIEYGRCCWRIRALLRSYTDGTGDSHNLGFLFQLELNGLGRFGDRIDDTLKRGIYGYRANYEE
ncbi:MAG: LPS assembly protein LptD [Chromatiaceae bacterium]|nr:LPS assembly protein LptD [Chromatiaceae bacterium]